MSRSIHRFLWLGLPLLSACVPANEAQTAAAPPPPMTAQNAAPPPAGGNPLALNFKTPDAAKGEQLSAGCAQCHGAKGQSTNPKNPGLAGQIPEYLHLQMAAFRAKLRPSQVMQGVASKLSDQDIADLTAYYAAQAPGPAWPADAAARARGEKLFMAGDAGRNVIACQICHGPGGRGINENGVASVTNLAPNYAVEVMHEFRDSPSFGGIIHPEAMRIALKPLTDSDLTDVAAYMSSMK